MSKSNKNQNQVPLFNLGVISGTPGATETLKKYKISAESLLKRHQCGDCGDMCESDKEVNRQAIEFGQQQIQSSYQINETVKIWVITTWNRWNTVVMLPSEY
jgi:hypothetical protein